MLGARFLEIDLHYIEATNRMVACHNDDDAAKKLRLYCIFILGWDVCNSYNVFDYGVHTGCPPDAPSIQIYFDEIQEWLTSSGNEDEFVIILLDSGVFESHPEVVETLIASSFDTESIFSPADFDALSKSVFPSITDLIASGKRLMFVSTAKQ